MGYKALLTLDLENGVSTEKREKFYAYLTQEKWIKIPNLTTAWKCTFNNDVTEESAISVVKNDVANAAKHAGVYSYNAAVQMGGSDVTQF
ncbi:MAG: hypothetical protein ACRCS2_11430 [Morganella morganii]|uniref:Uncharacterized protein n=1 Tax=Aeromonas sanarellii TaxID=633415 RepID=A0ABS4B4B8_9GAMM|nr:hypothetical protein [Aeromonas sanarellii]MBP0602323.1 hypothetical protein [Aeromonas sanarellii]